jgi:hypothetical protein
LGWRGERVIYDPDESLITGTRIIFLVGTPGCTSLITLFTLHKLYCLVSRPMAFGILTVFGHHIRQQICKFKDFS